MKSPVAIVALAAVLLIMLGELSLSRRNERALRARGAVMPPDPVYPTMRWAYPTVFVLMALEGAFAHRVSNTTLLIGGGVFAASKLLKAWAVGTLGQRWSFKIMVLPGVPLIAAGPYRYLRHPNYLALVGEFVGFAVMTEAYVTGTLGTVFFSWLLLQRIDAEERALR